ncbi:MAG: ThuA domain-containing protein [Limisphaerales bacterium]
MKMLRPFLLTVVVSLACSFAHAEPKKVLVVTATEGFPHTSVITAERVLNKLGAQSGAYKVAAVIRSGPRPKDTAEENKWMEKMRHDFAELMSPAALNDYDAVIFANTTGELPIPDKDAFINWVKAGHAFIGMHSATDTLHKYSPFIEMIGGEFLQHGPQVSVTCLNQDIRHPSTRRLGATYEVFDEIYQFKNFHRDQVHGLLTLDKHPNNKTPGDYPVAWCKQFGRGKVFYTSLGHREEVWDSPTYQDHVLGAIRWALGLEQGDAAPQSAALKLPQREKIDGYQALFTGVDLANWNVRNLEKESPWHIDNGMLIEHANESINDLVTEKPHTDFVLRFEYMVAGNGSSSILLRGRYDVLDKIALPAPGVWQLVEIMLIGDKVSVTVNQRPVYDKQPLSEVSTEAPDSPSAEKSPLILQGGHGPVAYRNMRIRDLSPFDIRIMNGESSYFYKTAKSSKGSKGSNAPKPAKAVKMAKPSKSLKTPKAKTSGDALSTAVN